MNVIYSPRTTHCPFIKMFDFLKNTAALKNIQQEQKTQAIVSNIKTELQSNRKHMMLIADIGHRLKSKYDADEIKQCVIDNPNQFEFVDDTVVYLRETTKEKIDKCVDEPQFVEIIKDTPCGITTEQLKDSEISKMPENVHKITHKSQVTLFYVPKTSRFTNIDANIVQVWNNTKPPADVLMTCKSNNCQAHESTKSIIDNIPKKQRKIRKITNTHIDI